MKTEIPWFDDYNVTVGIAKRKLKKGVIYRLRYKDPTGHEHFPKIGSSLDEAKKKAKETTKRLIRQEWNETEKIKILQFLQTQFVSESQNNSRLTVPQAMEKYKKSVLRGSTRNTSCNYSLLLKRIEKLFLKVCPHKIYIDEIIAEDIEDVLFTKQKDTFLWRGELKQPEDIVIDDYLRTIRRIFKFLVERDYVPKNPALCVKYLCEGGQKVRSTIPEDDEVKRIFEELEHVSTKYSNYSNCSPLKDIIHFLVETGARIGEVLAMEWRDIQEGHWCIREKKCSDGFYFKPKSKKSNRELFLTDEMLKILDRLPKVSPFVFPKAQVRVSDNCPSKKVQKSVSLLYVSDRKKP